jgi:hypothetical protein
MKKILLAKDVQMASKHMKRSYIICHRKMQLKTVLDIPRMNEIQNNNNSIASEDVEQQELFLLLVVMQNGTATFKDSLTVSYKTGHTLTLQSSSHAP